MVSKQLVQKQLKKLGVNPKGWGRSEYNELHNILLPDEEVLEIANGFYEGGFAMLLATDVRVLLVDKKPLSFLTVEDLRFDMINEMDYSARLIGAQINIASGDKRLKFSCLDKAKLHKLINHIQHEMAQSKKKSATHQEDQKSHLEQINQQLQIYLMAQHQYQQQMQEVQKAQQQGNVPVPPLPDPVKPSPELADYLYAQRLMAQHEEQTGQKAPKEDKSEDNQADKAESKNDDHPEPVKVTEQAPAPSEDSSRHDIYDAAIKEIFGAHPDKQSKTDAAPASETHMPQKVLNNVLEINPMKIAYSKLPMALRNRKFGRPSFHAHSVADSYINKLDADDSQQPAAAA